MAHLLDADGDHRPAGLQVVIVSICHIARRHRRLAVADGVPALAILLLFVGPHIGNHLAGFWSGSVHTQIMNAARRVYRDDIFQPILLALIGFQIHRAGN